MSRISESTYANYYASLLAGDRRACSQMVQELLAAEIPLDDLYVNLYQRSLYDVGAGWERNEISVAKEHVATALTQGLMQLSYRRLFGVDRIGRSLVLACVPGEYHQIGAMIVTDMFELWGWDTQFVGANTPLADLKALLAQTKPDLVGLSVSLARNIDTLNQAVNEIRAAYPNQELVVGGQGLMAAGLNSMSQVARLTYVETLAALKEFVGHLH